MGERTESIIENTIIDLNNTFPGIVNQEIEIHKARLYPETGSVAMARPNNRGDSVTDVMSDFPTGDWVYIIVFDYGMMGYMDQVGRDDFIQNVASHEYSHLYIKSPEPAPDKTKVFDEGLVSRRKLFFMVDNILPRLSGDTPWFASRVAEGDINLRSISKKELILKAGVEGEVNELFAVTFGNSYSGMNALQRQRINRGVNPHIKDFYSNNTEELRSQKIVSIV